ncbi:MAG: Uma2 family endonuclease [Bryobacteraceae bacterium]
MAAKTLVSMDEYLKTSFPDLDCEYVDGEIVERSVPAYSHGKLQKRFLIFLDALSKRWPLFPTVETRVRVSANRVRLPDVSAYSPHEPADSDLSLAPHIVIEVLSPDDRMLDVLEKLSEYRAMGIPHIWAVDPLSQRLYEYSGSLNQVHSFQLPEFEIEITPAEIFG